MKQNYCRLDMFLTFLQGVYNYNDTKLFFLNDFFVKIKSNRCCQNNIFLVLEILDKNFYPNTKT